MLAFALAALLGTVWLFYIVGGLNKAINDANGWNTGTVNSGNQGWIGTTVGNSPNFSTGSWGTTGPEVGWGNTTVGFDEIQSICKKASELANSKDTLELCRKISGYRENNSLLLQKLTGFENRVSELSADNNRIRQSAAIQKIEADREVARRAADESRRKLEADERRSEQMTNFVSGLLGRFALVLLALLAIKYFFDRSRTCSDRAQYLQICAAAIELAQSRTGGPGELATTLLSEYRLQEPKSPEKSDDASAGVLNALISRIPKLEK